MDLLDALRLIHCIVLLEWWGRLVGLIGLIDLLGLARLNDAIKLDWVASIDESVTMVDWTDIL
eukprot:11164867-Lingulodinium_polyedra.AAC.1